MKDDNHDITSVQLLIIAIGSLLIGTLIETFIHKHEPLVIIPGLRPSEQKTPLRK